MTVSKIPTCITCEHWVKCVRLNDEGTCDVIKDGLDFDYWGSGEGAVETIYTKESFGCSLHKSIKTK